MNVFVQLWLTTAIALFISLFTHDINYFRKEEKQLCLTEKEQTKK